MAYVPVPKDLTQVKTKVALNLTKRQLIFFSMAAVVGVMLAAGSVVAGILFGSRKKKKLNKKED